MKTAIGVIGLGYVGLPLAVEFAKKYNTVGLDINSTRLELLNKYNDTSNEVSSDELKSVITKNKNIDTNSGLFLTNSIEDLSHVNVFIVTVPTPVDKYNKPNLGPLLLASKSVGLVIKKSDIVIYESTVYPGTTEEECVPVIEKESGLKFNKDFFVGYSPERMVPGDESKTFSKILKITSGSNNKTALFVDELYKSVVSAGTYLAPSIQVAESAKVIENAQRDINIAFVNELSKIFNLLNIDTNEVLKAAGTKWNFLHFKPGLVGGHCIGVDPYYLAQKAEEKGYHPEIILSGRRINDSMGSYVARQVIKLIINKGISVKKSKILILGITFKENCNDFRNTKIVDIVNELLSFGALPTIYDPLVDSTEFKNEYRLDVLNHPPKIKFDAIILAVPHKQFLNLELKSFKNSSCVVYDIKGVLKETVDGKL
jgi:UDP-N-acetyl-D-glucosamine/UDP-N-acetyl-D-galactosamine dehydrogenase